MEEFTYGEGDDFEQLEHCRAKRNDKPFSQENTREGLSAECAHMAVGDFVRCAAYRHSGLCLCEGYRDSQHKLFDIGDKRAQGDNGHCGEYPEHDIHNCTNIDSGCADWYRLRHLS